MKHFKRSSYRVETRKAVDSYYYDGNESKILQAQINQAWEEREQEEAARIQKETNCCWEEYYSSVNDDCMDKDTIIAIQKYLHSSDNHIETEELGYLYQKNQQRGIRRKRTAYANKRLNQKSEAAMKNSVKRKENDSKNHVKISKKEPEADENDLKNLCLNSNKEVKSRVARLKTLKKRVK